VSGEREELAATNPAQPSVLSPSIEFDNKPYTVYRISIGGIEFEKRYSEFRDFYDALIAKTGYEFPNFPGKLSFNNMGAATIQKSS
jgi:hypothetical protein